MIAKPLRVTANRLEINYSTSAPGFMRVEIQDANGKPFPGFSLSECREIVSDKIGHVVSWTHGSEVSKLGGKPVRLNFAMKDTDLPFDSTEPLPPVRFRNRKALWELLVLTCQQSNFARIIPNTSRVIPKGMPPPGLSQPDNHLVF